MEEAKIISEAVREHFRHRPEESLGVVAMSAEQRLQLERAIEMLAKEDAVFQGWLDEDERLAQGALRGIQFKIEIQKAPKYKYPIFSHEMLKEYEEVIKNPLINIIFSKEIVDEQDHKVVQQEIIDILENISQAGINIFNLKE